MKNINKKLTGFSVVFVFFLVAALVLTTEKVLALVPSDFNNAVYTMSEDRSTIAVTNVIGVSGSIEFSDSNTGDTIYNYKYYGGGEPICPQAGDTEGIYFTNPIPDGPTTITGRINIDLEDETPVNPADPCSGGSTLNRQIQVQVPGSEEPPEDGEPCNEGDPGCVCEGEGDDQICTSGPVDDNSRCVDAGSTLMEWFLCPLTTGIGGAVDQLNNWIGDLLTIDTEEFFTEEVKEVWSAVRVIATSILVIVMLVMIISQAIGRGPFA